MKNKRNKFLFYAAFAFAFALSTVFAFLPDAADAEAERLTIRAVSYDALGGLTVVTDDICAEAFIESELITVTDKNGEEHIADAAHCKKLPYAENVVSIPLEDHPSPELLSDGKIVFEKDFSVSKDGEKIDEAQTWTSSAFDEDFGVVDFSLSDSGEKTSGSDIDCSDTKKSDSDEEFSSFDGDDEMPPFGFFESDSSYGDSGTDENPEPGSDGYKPDPDSESENEPYPEESDSSRPHGNDGDDESTGTSESDYPESSSSNPSPSESAETRENEKDSEKDSEKESDGESAEESGESVKESSEESNESETESPETPYEDFTAETNLEILLFGTAKLNPAIIPENATVGKFYYSSDNPEIATVSDDGTITAVSRGKCVITIILKGYNDLEISKQTEVFVYDEIEDIKCNSEIVLRVNENGIKADDLEFTFTYKSGLIITKTIQNATLRCVTDDDGKVKGVLSFTEDGEDYSFDIPVSFKAADCFEGCGNGCASEATNGVFEGYSLALLLAVALTIIKKIH